MPKSIIDTQRFVDQDTGEVFDVVQPTIVPSLEEAKPQIIRVDSIQHCPRCNKPLVAAKAINGSESLSFKECPQCGTLINTFKPTAYQAMFLRRRERYKMTAGGYGSGKSRANIEDVIKHIMLVQNARVAVTARTYPALEATFVKEFYSIFPMKLIRRKNDQKHELQLTNGSEILFRSFDDETKLKSINLTMAVIVEASDVPFGGFTMLQSRIRNTAAMIPEVDEHGQPKMQWDPNQQVYKPKYRVDARHINLETNPDSGWVKSKFLLDSETVEFYGDAYNEGYKFNKERDPQKYTQIISTSANPFLPVTYEEEQTRGKSKAYIQQFYKGSFNFSSNLVFPNFGVCIVAPHPLPRAFDESGKRVLYYLIGVDYGINDPTHIVYGAFSTETKKLYVYDELRINNSDIKTIAKEYRKETKLNGTDLDGLLMMPKFDGRSYSKRESNLVTIGSMFEDEGLYFEPSFATHDARIIKMNSLLNHNQIEVYSTCEFLIDEALNYKFQLDKSGAPTAKPEDGRDHGITALEFIVVELPHNLQELKLNVFLPSGKSFIHDKQKSAIIKKTANYYDPLKENTNNGNSDSFGNNLTYTGNDRVVAASSIFDEDSEKTDEENFNKPLSAWIPK